MLLKRVVTVVQAFALLVVAVSVVSLVVHQAPTPAPVVVASDAPSTAGAGPAPDGRALYLASCAGCHGEQGEGTYAPVLKGGAAAARHPGADAQVAFVLAGGGDMPGFAGRLTPDEVRAIVDHVATLP